VWFAQGREPLIAAVTADPSPPPAAVELPLDPLADRPPVEILLPAEPLCIT